MTPRREDTPPEQGCHQAVAASVDELADLAELAECKAAAGGEPAPDTAGVYRPSALPCGACDGAPPCTIAITPSCYSREDIGTTYFSGYFDEWLCDCACGTWRCRVLGQSGATCNDGLSPD